MSLYLGPQTSSPCSWLLTANYDAAVVVRFAAGLTPALAGMGPQFKILVRIQNAGRLGMCYRHCISPSSRDEVQQMFAEHALTCNLVVFRAGQLQIGSKSDFLAGATALYDVPVHCTTNQNLYRIPRYRESTH